MEDLSEKTKELSKLFNTSEHIVLVSHINPDGDAIGSQLALFQYLRAIGRNVSMFTPNNIQEFLKWMEGADKVSVFIKERSKCRKMIEEADLIIMFDFNQMNRLGEAEAYVRKSGARKVIIDHHLNPENIADIVISDPSMCSTAELVHEIVGRISSPPFKNKAYAEALYVGIVTDTGNFEHGSYSSDTFRTVADLIDCGIEKEKILNLVYNNFSADRLRLQGFALYNRMVVMPENHTAYIYLTRDDLREFNHVKGDTEGFVNMPLSIKGIYFSAMFIEKDNFIKLSFRSSGSFPTNEFASRFFSGGGHLNASGGEYHDTLENTIEYFLESLKTVKVNF